MSPAQARSLLVGAAGLPSMVQVSIEQDLALARDVLGGRQGSYLLFGSGAGFSAVHELATNNGGDPLLLMLADLFAPRPDRVARYRKTVLSPDGPATREAVLAALGQARAHEGAPLLLYIAGHGEIGEQPRDNIVSLWEDGTLSAADLAAALDGSPQQRPLRVVSTTCFSGGFAELAFRDGDERRGASTDERCGLFSTTWDLEAAGCDPDPERRAQENYALHFLNALRGRDAQAQGLPRANLDLDGDGRISLLEAHTRVRLASRTPDVPTSTSERWLRHAVPAANKTSATRLRIPEEDAVIAGLSSLLGVGDSKEAEARLRRLEEEAGKLREAMQSAEEEVSVAARRAAAVILSRWPVLDDPWHPDFPRTLGESRASLQKFFDSSHEYTAYLEANGRAEQAAAAHWEQRRMAALYERLMRAFENERLAARLRAAGGEPWRIYERLLACERGSP